MTLDDALDSYWTAAYAEGRRNATHDTSAGLAQTSLLAVQSCVQMLVAAERKRIAAEWDGCVHEGIGGDVDIGACIRAGRGS